MNAMATELADAIVAAHNAEGRVLSAWSFELFTSRLTLDERHLVLRELPPWARRLVEQGTTDRTPVSA